MCVRRTWSGVTKPDLDVCARIQQLGSLRAREGVIDVVVIDGVVLDAHKTVASPKVQKGGAFFAGGGTSGCSARGGDFDAGWEFLPVDRVQVCPVLCRGASACCLETGKRHGCRVWHLSDRR